MSHHVYTTPGFIIDSRTSGEAGKVLYIFTKDLGLVVATAQGLRQNLSKLRYHTQDFTYGTYSLVRGKEMWRLVGAGPVGDVSEYTRAQTINQLHFLRARIFALLKRFLHGEEPNPELFEILAGLDGFIHGGEVVDDEVDSLECLSVLRILYSLGYIDASSKLRAGLAKFFEKNAKSVWSHDTLREVKESRALAIQAINEGLKASHL